MKILFWWSEFRVSKICKNLNNSVHYFSKRYQGEQNWRPNLLHPPFLQHHPIVPLYLRYTPPPRINFVGGTQNRPGIGNRLSDEGTIKNFNMPFIYNPPIMAPPDVLDSRLRMPLRLPELSADFELPLQLPSSSRIERTENK